MDSKPVWIKSSYSANADNACVEVSHPSPALILTRDSKLDLSPEVGFRTEAWAQFLHRLP